MITIGVPWRKDEFEILEDFPTSILVNACTVLKERKYCLSAYFISFLFKDLLTFFCYL